ncbi:MAG: LURP-one-related/scramblase family protein [Enterococcus sp.]
MSEFFIQEKQLSRVTRTIIKDEAGKAQYLLVGRWGTKGDALSLYAMNGELIASIKQVSLTFGNRFEIYQNFMKVGTLHKIFNWPGDFYYVRHLHWTVQGDIYHHHYGIHHFNHPVMTMKPINLVTGDFYALKITDDEDAPICICIAAILDYWLYNRSKRDQERFALKFSLAH